MSFKKSILLSLLTLFVWQVQAKPLSRFSHQSTPTETAAALEHNLKFREANLKKKNLWSTTLATWQPVEDTGNFAYVLMNAEEDGSAEVKNLRRTIAENLPVGVTLVILTPKSKVASIKAQYAAWIPANRLIVASDADPYTSNGFWARDSFPVPVINRATGETSLVASKYFRKFNSADTIGAAVNANLAKETFVFVGGNLLADEDGNCFSIDSIRLYSVSSSDFTNVYGCKTHTMLNHYAGIGDVDEVIKPLPGKVMLTNRTEYVQKLKDLGYTVVMLPKPSGAYRTYANSLIVQKVVFMPSYGVAQDADAIKVYQDLGYTVVPVKSNYMSDYLNGSIHCQTMAYPAMSPAALAGALNLHIH